LTPDELAAACRALVPEAIAALREVVADKGAPRRIAAGESVAA
jgi:hypothetical protein